VTRIAIIDRADMDAEQARVHDAAIEAGGVVDGPYYAYIRVPHLFETAQNLRTCLGSGPLSDRERQVANLVVSRHWSAQYPWCAQVRVSLAVGLEQSVIDAINARQAPKLPDARERTCYEVSSELLTTMRLSDATYAEAEQTLGLEDLVVLVAVVGSFTTTCLTANAVDLDPPDEKSTPLAD